MIEFNGEVSSKCKKYILKRERRASLFLILSSCLIFCFMLSACRVPWIKYFYDYHGIWYCDDPFIEFVGDDISGVMDLDGKRQSIYVGCAVEGEVIYFHDNAPNEDGILDYPLIWEANSELKNGQLILTVVIDNVSNYEGKTIVLNQRPIEDN